jgi:membrane protein
LGCVIANFFSFNMIDVVVGSLSTLVFVGSGVYFFDRFKNQDILGGLFDKAHVFFAFYFSFFMVTIAAELTLVTQAPFWATWFTVAMGELASLLVGAILIKKLAKVIDFVS